MAESELFTALRAARSAFPIISRGRPVTVTTKSGGSFTYSYADLGDIYEAVLPALNENHLTVVQVLTEINGQPAISTALVHDDGGSINGVTPILVSGEGSQAHGSAITYARRYGLSTILGIVTEPDDDGAAGSGATQVQGYAEDGSNSDFETILRAAALSTSSDFTRSLARQIRERGTLSSKQITAGMKAAISELEDADD